MVSEKETILIFFFLALYFCTACQAAKSNTTAGLDPVVFSSKFDKSIDTTWTQQKASEDRLRLVYDSILHRNVLRAMVKPTDNIIGHNRAELNLARHHHSQPFDVINGVYEWKFRIPLDSLEDFTPLKWRVIAQWHDSPDEGKHWITSLQSDTANKIIEAGHPPPVAIELLKKDSVWVVGIRYGLQQGAQRRKMIATAPVLNNQWNSIKVHIHWSQTEKGFIEAKLNDKIITPFNGVNYLVYGRNMFNKIPNTFKIGIYRASGFTNDDVVYYSDIKIFKSSDKYLF